MSGYLIVNLCTVHLLTFARCWQGIVLIIVAERCGKGICTLARDDMLELRYGLTGLVYDRSLYAIATVMSMLCLAVLVLLMSVASQHLESVQPLRFFSVSR